MDFTEDWSNGTENWSFYTGARDNELEISTKVNHRIKRGKLFIDAKREADGSWTSAHLYSKIAVPQTGGVLTVEVKCPRVEGIWPAIWMLGSKYPADPWPQCGEIDLLEVPGKKMYGTAGPLLHGNLHGVTSGASGKPAYHWQSARRTTFQPDTWMKVGLDLRTPEKIIWLVNNKPVSSWQMSDLPSDAIWPMKSDGMMLILSCAVGGWAGSPTDETPDVVTTAFGRITWREG